MSKIKPSIPILQLIRRLRLMADAGGMLTRDRIEAIRQAADWIDERVAITIEHTGGDDNA